MAERIPIFLIYHDSKADSAAVELEIRRQRCVLEKATKASEILDLLASKSADGLILNLTKLEPNVALFGSKVNSLGKNIAILALYDSIDPQAAEAVAKTPNLVAMQKPLKNGTLSFLCDKIVQGEGVRNRKHVRYSTEQTGTITKLGSEEAFPARVLNLSKGGAYVEFADAELKFKEIIKLTLPLEKLSKTRTLSARVMWVREITGNRRGAGLEFISDDEAYLSLVDKD